MKNIINRVNEAGTLLVEALAMLGLISMVTPVLYKKAAERTVELQDINASGQMRAMSSAMDSFLKDNFSTITNGGNVVSNGATISFSDFDGHDSGKITFTDGDRATFVKALAPYLPYGFTDGDSGIKETKLFNQDYDFAIVMNGVDSESGKKLNRTLTGFFVANPKNNTTEVTPIRAARIASMIGSNGGYVDDTDTARGTQGIWSTPMGDLGLADAAHNAIVVSSLQPISSQSLDEELLHRIDKDDAGDLLNTMETDLFMGTADSEDVTGHNIRMVNQIIMRPKQGLMVDATGQSKSSDGSTLGVVHNDIDDNYSQSMENALYIGDGGGANISGVLQAVDQHFKVGENGIQYFGDTTVTPPGGEPEPIMNEEATFSVDDSKLIYGNPSDNAYKLTVDTENDTFEYGQSEIIAPIGIGPGGAPITADVTSKPIYANNRSIEIGRYMGKNPGLSVHYLQGAAGFGIPFLANSKNVAVINGTSDDIHSGSVTTYSWDGGYPSSPVDRTNYKYELSVNGSAFVKDTLLTGKIKTYNGDFATLRAGVDADELDTASDSNYFMKVRNEKDDADRDNKSFVVGGFPAGPAGTTETRTVLRVRDGENFASQNKSSGILMATGDTLGEGGINIMSATQEGANIQAPLVDDNYDIVDWVDDGANGFSQIGMVKIGGYNGVYINSGIEAPVAINGDMFRAYRTSDMNDKIWSVIDINSDKYYVRPSYDSTHVTQTQRMGDYAIQDMIMSVTASYENASPTYSEFDVFKVNPWMTDDRFLLGEDTSYYVTVPENSTTPRAIEMTGSVAVYDYDRYAYDPSGTNPQFPSFTIDRGEVAIRATQDVPNKEIAKGDRIFNVDNYSGQIFDGTPFNGQARPDERGSVYIRKGSINLDPAQPTDPAKAVTRVKETDLNYATGVTPQGYIAADRFVSHNTDADAMIANRATGSSIHGDLKSGSTYYNRYEVNPAYTSVMHDIKLTTRGGARLSDILPDFINKGIYVVDASYKEQAAHWANEGFRPIDFVKSGANEAAPGGNASAFLGFVPTPKCPPNYAKVVTLTPAGWAMAQAGKLYPNANDVGMNTDTHEILYGEGDPADNALNFQKSTWLKSMVLKYYGDTTTGDDGFKGWSAIMGFIYPSTIWDRNINYTAVATKSSNDDEEFVYWNLFPVKYKELEGYATVYCYFDRKQFKGAYNGHDFVDVTYDQLEDMRSGSESVLTSKLKGTNRNSSDSNLSKKYLERLDDPALKYESPW